MSIINNKKDLKDIFYEETENKINEMREDLSVMSNRMYYPGRLDDVEKYGNSILYHLLLCAHTIKSSAASEGFIELNELSRALEKIFKSAMDNQCEVNADVISLAIEGVEACQKLLYKENVTDYDRLLKRLNSILTIE